MSTTKHAVPQKKDAIYWVVTVGTILFYFIAYGLLVFIGYKNSSPSANDSNADVFQIIWDSLGNAGTLIPLSVAIISALLLRWKNKQLSTGNIAFISTAGFLIYCFYSLLLVVFQIIYIVQLLYCLLKLIALQTLHFQNVIY